MQNKVEKKSPPLLMILVLILAVMPLSLQVVGLNINFSHTFGSIITTYARVVNLWGCTYQPGLVTEMVALLNELPCEGAKPSAENSPGTDQIACNPDQITMDEEISVEPGIVLENYPSVSDSQPLILRVSRLKRSMAKMARPEIPTLQNSEILEIALAQKTDLPYRYSFTKPAGKDFALSFVSKPAISSRQANEFARQVKASFSGEPALEWYSEKEELKKRAEKIRVLTVNCNFKGLRAFYEAEATKPVKAVRRATAEIETKLFEMGKLPEPKLGEF